MDDIFDQILIVDDNQSIREVLREYVSNAGYTCQTAESGTSAIKQLAQQQPFELVLTDLNMPGIDGMELLEHVLSNYPETAVIMVTGVDTVGAAVKAMSLGAYDYIQKPVTFGELVLRIQRAFERRKLLQAERNRQQELEQEVLKKTEQVRAQLEQIQQTYLEAQEALIVALGFRDTETKGHCRRVREYAIAVGKAMKLPEEEITHLERGALLHDIGKIGIPDRILHKPGSLTDEEFVTIRKHPVIGHQMVQEIKFLAPAAPVVHSHHERYDGSGYPDQLAGEDIPLAARIFAIVDTFDVITSPRPYKEAQPVSEAREEIARSAGSHFDPAIVEVFLNIPDEEFLEIRSRIG